MDGSNNEGVGSDACEGFLSDTLNHRRAGGIEKISNLNACHAEKL
jgi:hypothetical protein